VVEKTEGKEKDDAAINWREKNRLKDVAILVGVLG